MLVTIHIDVEYIQDIQGPAITERPTLFNSPALNLPWDRRVAHFKLLFFFFFLLGFAADGNNPILKAPYCKYAAIHDGFIRNVSALN